MTAPAVLSRAARNGSPDLSKTKLSFLGSPTASNVFAALAAAELIGDKLPFIPNRTDVGPLIGRITSGGLCGAAITAAKGESLALGAVVGGVAAVIGTFAGYHLRHKAVHEAGAPPLVAAVIEDALAILGGTAAVKAFCEERHLALEPSSDSAS